MKHTYTSLIVVLGLTSSLFVATPALARPVPQPYVQPLIADQVLSRGLGDVPLVVLGNYQSGNGNQAGDNNVQSSVSTANVQGDGNSLSQASPGSAQSQSQVANQQAVQSSAPVSPSTPSGSDQVVDNGKGTVDQAAVVPNGQTTVSQSGNEQSTASKESQPQTQTSVSNQQVSQQAVATGGQDINQTANQSTAQTGGNGRQLSQVTQNIVGTAQQ